MEDPKSRPAKAQGAASESARIDFQELLSRLLPLENLTLGEHSSAEAFHTQVAAPLEDAGRLALTRLGPRIPSERAPDPAGISPVAAPARAAAPLEPPPLEVAAVAGPGPRNAAAAPGILVHPRVELLPQARYGLEQVQRLIRFDDPLLYSETLRGNARERLIQQLDQAGREALCGREVRLIAIEDPGTARPEHFDRELAREALSNTGAVFYCPDVCSSYRLEVEGRRRGIRSVVVAGVVSREGTALGVLEASSPEPQAFGIEDLALVALLADCSAAALERATRIEKLMFIDPLTSANNRSYFELQVQNEMARARREGSMALLIADIDDFKSFNTRFGYQAGNQVLVHVAQVLKRGVRPFDTVSRWGGEEFAVVLTAPVQAQDVLTISERLRTSVDRDPVWIRSLDGRSQRVVVTVSIGVAMFPEHGSDVTEIWRAANQALLRAKRPPKNQVVFYAPTAGGHGV